MKLSIVFFVLFALLGSVFSDDFDGFSDFEEELQEQVDVAHVPDPLEPLNRGIWWFNDKLYLYVLEPVASGYSKVIPKAGRQSIANVFDNLQAPERVVNNLLQLKFADTGTELKRFVCN